MIYDAAITVRCQQCGGSEVVRLMSVTQLSGRLQQGEPLRHGLRIEDKATVIGRADGSPFRFNGRESWVAVLDAQYRASSRPFFANGQAQAADAALAVSLHGRQCALPTVDVLVEIWRQREFLDRIDPSGIEYKQKKLSNWGFDSADGANVWSSSEYDSNDAVYVNSGGYVGNSYLKNTQFGVVPVLEIPT